MISMALCSAQALPLSHDSTTSSAQPMPQLYELFAADCHDCSMIMAAFKAGAGYNTGSTTIPAALAGPIGPQLQRAQTPFPVGGGGAINSGGSLQQSTPSEQPRADNSGAPASTRANEVSHPGCVVRMQIAINHGQSL